MLKRTILFIVTLLLITDLFGQSAQNISIKMKDASLKDVFTNLEAKYGYTFVYVNSEIDDSRKVTVEVNNVDIKSALSTIFSELNIDFELTSKQITLKPSKPKSNLTNVVKGKVTDAGGLGIPGVNVVLKGTSTGIMTEPDGTYTFNLPKGTANPILIFSFIGFNDVEMDAGSKSVIDVKMNEAVDRLDEVVVVGYGTQKRVNLSGAVATVSLKTVKDRPITSIGQALQGSVANMNVNIGSGSANSSPSYNIRGVTSISNDGKGGSPLIVIDGIVSDNDVLNRLNSTDIENVTVLKDAASSAIYGSRAAFGVILITTKTGKTEKLRINYNNNFVWRKLTKLPEIISDPYLVADTRNIMSSPWYNLYNEEELAYAKSRSEDPSVSPYFVKPNGEYMYFGNTDWVNEAYKNSAMSTNHSIDISGKSDKVSYFFSGSYYFQDGMLKYGTDKYNKYNVRSKLDFKLTDFWTVGNNTSVIISDYTAPRFIESNYYWNINRQSPLDMPKNPDGTWTSAGAGVLGRMQDGGIKKDEDIILSTQFDTRLDLIKDVLFFKGNFAYNGRYNNNKSSTLPIAYYNGPGLPAKYYDETTSANGSNYKTSHVTFDVYGTFMKTFGKHTISSVVGFNQEEYRYEYMSAGRNNLISNSLPSWALATGDMSVGHKVETWALRGAFGRLNYTFADKYIVEFNGRYDGTSRFPKNDRFVFNPSGSLAWVVSSENFFAPVKNIISFMKFRASYGSLGNQDVGAYSYIPTMGSGSKTSVILDGKQPSWVSSSGLVSGRLTWEKVISRNFGMDINFLDNRLVTVFDIYNRQTKDMLTPGQDLPTVLGTGVPQENAADLETKGWEITIGWKDKFQVADKPFYYNINFNLADSRAYITKYANTTGSLSAPHYEGKEIGEIWGMETAGFFTSEDDIKNSADQSLVTSYPGTRPLAPGDIKFVDRDNSNEIDWGKWTNTDHGDYYKIGNSQSRFTFGFSVGAEWNGFDLNAFFQGVGKRDYAPGSGDLYFWGIYSQPWTNITQGNYYDRWTPETPNGYFPRFKSYVAESTSKEVAIPQTKYLQNAAYVRMKNLTLGYTIPEKVTKKINIDRLRIFFSGDNLFEISGLYKHYKVDPEGLGGQMYPFQRYYSLGVNVTF